MEAFAHIVEIAFAKEVPPDYSINCGLHLSYLKTTLTRTSYDSTTKYGLCQNTGFSLKRGRAVPRRAIERENGRGSNIYLFLKAAAMVLEHCWVVQKCALQAHNHKCLAVQTTSSVLV